MLIPSRVSISRISRGELHLLVLGTLGTSERPCPPATNSTGARGLKMSVFFHMFGNSVILRGQHLLKLLGLLKCDFSVW